MCAKRKQSPPNGDLHEQKAEPTLPFGNEQSTLTPSRRHGRFRTRTLSPKVSDFAPRLTYVKHGVADYTPLRSDPGARKFTIFIDWTSLKPTTSSHNNEDVCGNDMVVTLNLDKLPFTRWETLHRKFGGRSTLYVRNFTSLGE